MHQLKQRSASLNWPQALSGYLASLSIKRQTSRDACRNQEGGWVSSTWLKQAIKHSKGSAS